MKLAYVELAGFRGFKDKVRFDFPPGFAILTGRNGVGKSTALDAVDFALTGTLNKYAVREAKGGGLQDHIWWVGDGRPQDEYVSVGFIDNEGKGFDVTRSRQRGLQLSEQEIIARLCLPDFQIDDWARTLVQTSLIRDETIAALSLDLPEQARFEAVRTAVGGLRGRDHSVRTSAVLRAAINAREEQEQILAGLEADLGRGLSSLTEARSRADKQTDIAAADNVIKMLIPGLPVFAGDRSSMIRQTIAERKRLVVRKNLVEQNII